MTGAFDFGCPQAPAMPLAIALVTLPSWPLQSRLVLDRMEQPVRLMIGAPFNVSETCDRGWPLSRVRMQESSGLLARAVALAVTFMDGILMIARMDVGTSTATLPV